jgi:energy-coupling factor transporter ATP-binding protein EcfA2
MGDPVVELSHVSRRFGKKTALDDVSLSLPRGVVYGLVGANGAGKSTIIRHILGLLRAEGGTVRVFGTDPVAEPVSVLRRIGYLSEENDLPTWMRVGELVRYTRAFYPSWDDDYAEELRRAFGLDPAARIRDLSRGQKARAGLVAALAHRPELLVLDEPSSGLDPERVYVNGLSNGGGMTFALSCAAPERIAAAGIVAGAQTLGWELCPERVMPPVIVIHGTEDSVVPYRGGRTWIAPRPFPDVAGWVGIWAERNGCDAPSVEGASSATVTRRAYTGCEPGADVVLYTVDGDGHVWPGGGPVPTWLLGPDSGSLDATRVMWEFFRGRRAGG